MPKFKEQQRVKGGVLKRSQRRARRLIAADKMPEGVSPSKGISGREARALKVAHSRLKNQRAGGGFNQGISERAAERANAIPTIPGLDYSDDRFTRPEARRIKRGWRRAGRPQPYNPLERLSGRSFADEAKAAEEYEFGDERRALGREGRRLEQQEANTASYYDDYRSALAQSVANIRTAADSTAAAQQSSADTATAQDRARLEARDAEDAAVNAKFGRPATPSQEGARAVEARGFMAQSEAARMRERGLERVAQAERNVPLALLSKAQAVGREDARQRANFEDTRGLERRAGAFRTKYRADTRESEREWAAIQKEFKLQAGESKSDRALKKRELRVEKLKSFNQLKQAMLYAGADRKMASAIVQQAKLARNAKLISAAEYRKIAEINKAASDRRAQANENVAGTYGKSGNRGGRGKSGGGTGKSNLQPWERDQFSKATRLLKASPPPRKDGGTYTQFIEQMRKRGVKPYIAARAWRTFYKNWKGNSPNAPGAPGQGNRPN